MTIRILLADDQELVRSGMRALLERAEDLRVVGEAADGAEAVQLAKRHRPDVVLMDVRMPRLDGIEATRQIAAEPTLAGVHVVVLTTFHDDQTVLGAVRAGAAGFLVKDSRAEELRAAVRTVAAGEGLLSPAVTRTVLGELAATAGVDPQARARLERITAREHEVLEQVAQGFANDEIAEQLFLSPATVRTYVSRLLTKLDARDRAQLVVLAYQAGVVVPGR